jgi:hypothetical protein
VDDMRVPRPPAAKHPVEAAADRIMRLWSLIKLVPNHQLAEIRSSLVEKLSEQRNLSEDQLVVVGLKYLYENANSKTVR